MNPKELLEVPPLAYKFKIACPTCQHFVYIVWQGKRLLYCGMCGVKFQVKGDDR